MPIIHEKKYIDYSKFGGEPDTIWCAKLVLTLTIDNKGSSVINLIQDLGIDPNVNNIKAIDYGDGTGVHFITNNDINIDYEFRNNISNKYNITLYSDNDKIIYYPIDKMVNNIHIKTDNVKFNYNPKEKPLMKYTKRQIIANGYRIPSIKPHKAEDIFYMYVGQDLVFGSLINVKELCYDIEITDPNNEIRLINPLSHPRFSWERLKNHVEVKWGDGFITKWLDFYINSGRFNREIGYKLEHNYKANIGNKFTIKIKSKEPLVPIGCKITKIYGEFPADNYIVKKAKDSDEIVGLFGECYHVDYPELSLLNTHRSTITELGKDLCKNFLNTTMEREFENFTEIKTIPNGFFDYILDKVVSYNSCFKNNTNLVSSPINLLGYVNNTVIDIDNMFYGCGKLVNSINLRVSPTLITAKSVYEKCYKMTNLYPEFLYECTNLRFINNICAHCQSLTILNENQFLLSENIEEMPFAFFDTNIRNSHTLQNKGNLWNLRAAFAYPRRHGNLSEIPVDSFKNACNKTDKPLNLVQLFECQGGSPGLNVPVGLFSPLKDAKDIESINNVLSHCHFRGSDIPSDLFKDVFNKNKAKDSYSCFSIFGYPSCTNGSLEIRNKQFTGDNSKLTKLINHFASVNEHHPFKYINKDYLSELPNLTSVEGFFYGTRLDLIFPEDFLKNQRKINDCTNFLRNCEYLYNHFPIDYLIHTYSNKLNLTAMFKDSNIRTYRLIHWSSNKSIDVTTTGIYADNTQTVPLSYILDGRHNVNNEIPYKASTIKFITLSKIGAELVIEIKGTLVEPIEVDWGDGTVETISQNTTHITTKEQNIITVTGRNSVYIYANNCNLDCQEIHGEFPYDSEPFDIPSRNHYYVDPIYHIAKDYGEICGSSSMYMHPHYYKHATRLTKIKNNKYIPISGIPSKFYYNCQGLNTFKNIFNYNILMIPQNALPDTLNYSSGYSKDFFIGYLYDNNINRNKVHIFNDIIEKPYMNNVNFPFASSYVTIPWNSQIKKLEMVNEPMYEYIGFVIRESVTNLGLERLVNGDTRAIGKIKIEIRTYDKLISKEVNITNDSELTNIIGNIDIKEDTFGVIKIYSDIPLWLNNHNIIDEIRGVIPKCEFSKPMSSLAPNLSYVSETIFMRVTNKSFRGTMANLPRLRFIHRNMFICNTDANDFESCFENDISLYMIPDYLIAAKDFDINCKRMFKGCTNIDYVYRPICNSVRGLIEVDEMLDGCKTVNFNDSNIDKQVFNKLWIKGESKLTLKSMSSGIERALVDHPTSATSSGLTAEHYKAFTYVNGPVQLDLINEGNIDKVKYLAYKCRDTIAHQGFINKANKDTKDIAKMLKYFPNVTDIHFNKDEMWHTEDPNQGTKIFQTFDPNLFMYQEKLHTITYVYSNTVVNTPIDNTFLVFNESINSIKGFLLNSGIKHKDSLDKSAILGYDHLGFAFLGAEGIRIPLELGSAFFTHNMECMNDLTDAFRNVWGDFSNDSWIIGKCHPLHFNSTFAVDDNKQNVRRIGVPLTDNLVKNIWDINSNPDKSKVFNAYVEFIDTFKGNPNVTNDRNFIDRVLNVAAYLPNGRILSVFENTPLRTYNVNTFNNRSYNNSIKIENVYKNTNIDKLPNIDNIPNSESFKGLVSNCLNINEVVPENYIDSHKESCDISDIFNGSSNIKVNNSFIKENDKTVYNVSNSLTDVVSTIGGDSRIYKGVNYMNESNVFNINNMLSVNTSNIFTQAIRVLSDNTVIYPEMLCTFIPNFDMNNGLLEYTIIDKLQIDWGDNSTLTLYKGMKITEDDITHIYKKMGTYYVRLYLDGITLFIMTENTDKVYTIGISEFCCDDIKDILETIEGFELCEWFGHKITYIADYPFKYMKNTNLITSLSMFRDQSLLRYEPKVITEDMVNLRYIDYYYYGCKGIYEFDVNTIPLSIRNNITYCMYTYGRSGVTDSTHLLDGYDNIESVIGFLESCNNMNIFNPRMLNNKANLKYVDSFIKGCKLISIDKTYNEMFYGCPNIKYLYETFADVKINEFPNEILYYLPNLIECHNTFKLYNDNIIDNEFTLDENVFKHNENIYSILGMFEGRKSLVDYNKDIFKYNKKLISYHKAFKDTGIKTLHKYTITVGLIDNYEYIDCRYMFDNCPVTFIEGDLIKQNDLRIVEIDSMLNNISGLLEEKFVIGNIKYVGNSGYTRKSDSYVLNVNNLSNIKLVPVDSLLNYPIHIEYTIILGKDRKYINTLVNSKEELENKLIFNLSEPINEIKIISINSPKLTYII